MTSLIKNQILKHLTKFFKDLAPEQLQLSAFKGSCELSNLQLEENVLMDLLSFPAWVRINKAVCDQLSIKIPWTKIKSVPIQMNLNEVTVEVEVCDEFRDTNGEDELNIANLINSAAQPGKYGFVDRVIDGITVTVNNVLITFKSKLMSATFNLSRVLLESRCPNWKPGELSLTRIKDTNRSQILLFKIVEWQTMRLEAKCLTDPLQAPLRLITNHAQCRLTIKKKLDDCSVLAARIFVIFEDILWVLTFAQFISAASFVEYVFTLIKRSPISKKTGIFDDHSVDSQANILSAANTSATQYSGSQPNQSAPTIISSTLNSSTQSNYTDKQASMLTGNLSSASLLEQKFLCYDLIETSLHLFIDKIDAHLYDDIEMSTNSTNRDSGGALQTTLDQIQVDCYPYSRAIGDRKHWYKWFDPSPNSRKQWFASHFAEFDQIKRQNQNNSETTTTTGNVNLFDESHNIDATNINNKSKDQQLIGTDELLLSLTVLVKIKDYCMNCVATKHSMRGIGLQKFIQTDKDYHMPSDMPSLYLELNYFYYFDTINRMMIYENVPDPLAFVHLSPTKLLFDSPTLLFLNSFQVNLSKALVLLNDLFPDETTAPKIHCRVEILMPQISLPAKPNNTKQQEQTTTTSTANNNAANINSTATSSLLLKSGKVTLSNSIHDKNVLSKLMASIDILKDGPCQPINMSGSYHAKRENSCTGDWNKVWNASLINKMSEFNLQNQLWSIQFEPVWMDFMNYDVDDLSTSQRLEPIVEPVHAYAFVHLNLSSPIRESSSNKSRSQSMSSANLENNKYATAVGLEGDNLIMNNSGNKRDIISILVTVMDGSILANMDRVQFSFLQRLGMHVEKLFQQIREDASSIIQLDTTIEGSFEVNLTAYIKEIKARLILEKKIEKQFVDCLESSMRSRDKSYCDNLNDETTNYEVDDKQLSTIQAGAIISNQSNLDCSNITTNSFFNMKPTLLKPITSEHKLEEERIIGVVYSPGDTTDQLGDDLALDECAEVADDASCLFLGLNCDQKTNLSTDIVDSANNIIKTTPIDVSLPKVTTSEQTNKNSQSSVGKSSKESSLLIDLDDMVQSSSLFAKVDLKSTPSPSNNNNNNNGAPVNNSQQQHQSQQSQQQETETESISYLELSMSQLMVRRITETKRRQKF